MPTLADSVLNSIDFDVSDNEIGKANDASLSNPATVRIEKNKETAISKNIILEEENKELRNKIEALLLDKNSEEEKQKIRLEKGESIIHLIDPSLIHTQDIYINRPESDYEGEEFENFRNSIGKFQKTPILISYSPVEDGKYLLIHGEKRLRACQQNNQQVRAEIIEYNPEQHLIDGLIENMQRNDPPPYLLGVAIITIMKTNDKYKTQSSICQAIDKSKGYVSKLVKIGSIPKEIIECFNDIRSISTYKLEKFLTHIDNYKYQSMYVKLCDQLMTYKIDPYYQEIDDELLIKILNNLDVTSTLTNLIDINFTNANININDLIKDSFDEYEKRKKEHLEAKERIRIELEKSKNNVNALKNKRKTTEKLRIINNQGKEVGFFYRLPDGTAKFKFNKEMNELAEKIRVAIENNQFG